MHASIWKMTGDPDELLSRYDAMVAEIPAENMVLHICLRADDGIVVIDTCPTREIYEMFIASPELRALRSKHGLPDPESIEDHPVHRVFVDGVTTVGA